MKVTSHQPKNWLPKNHLSRSGFTLLELMIVVVIIALLIGLLLPAVNGVRVQARIAEVRNDIAQLEQGITQFKLSFGIEPPSFMELYANETDWNSTTGVRYKGLIKQMWPKFSFVNCGGASSGPPGVKIFTLPGGTTTSTLQLNGAECLVFFLGGMIDQSSGAFIGFAKDPAQPFSPAITNREGPFFEFKGALNTTSATFLGRLSDLDNDKLPEYRDTWPGQTSPYAYFNGTGGSYRTTAWTMGGPAWVNTDCQATTPVLMSYAYYSKFDSSQSPRNSLPYKKGGFQIISPGADALHGNGGLFDPNKSASLSPADRDNITNFHPGRLGI